MLFSEVVESSLVKTSAFLSLLQKILIFHNEVTLPRRYETMDGGVPKNDVRSVDTACRIDDSWLKESSLMDMNVVSAKKGLTLASYLLEYLIKMDVISIVSDKGNDVAVQFDGGVFGFK